MDEFWNTSETAPSTLDSFFDEESTITWNGLSDAIENDLSLSSPSPTVSSNETKSTADGEIQESLSSIIGNVTENVQATGVRLQSKFVGKSLEKLESLKGPSFKWAKTTADNSSCLQCHSKDEEIRLLKQRLDKSYSRHNITLPPEEIIRRMILGESYSLEPYKLLDDKLSLLAFAVDSLDSSTILEVTIFLKRTVKTKIFVNELKVRPLAGQIYVNYLKKRCYHKEALELMSALEKKEDALLLKYKIALSASDDATKAEKLRSSLRGSAPDPMLAHEAKFFEQHANLLDCQSIIDKADASNTSNDMLTKYPRTNKITGQTRLTALFYCCMYHWMEPETKVTSPLYLKNAFGISNRQFLWVALRARIRVNHWPMPSELDNVLGPTGMLKTLSNLTTFTTPRRSVRNILPVDQVVATLHANSAPPTVIGAYIDLSPTIEEKLNLALKYKCHRSVVDCYIATKDRASIETYLRELPAGSPEFVTAENALKNARW